MLSISCGDTPDLMVKCPISSLHGASQIYSEVVFSNELKLASPHKAQHSRRFYFNYFQLHIFTNVKVLKRDIDEEHRLVVRVVCTVHNWKLYKFRIKKKVKNVY